MQLVVLVQVGHVIDDVLEGVSMTVWSSDEEFRCHIDRWSDLSDAIAALIKKRFDWDDDLVWRIQKVEVEY